MMRKTVAVAFALLFGFGASLAHAQPATTQPNISNLITQCASGVPVVGGSGGAGTSPICWATGALGALAHLGSPLGAANGGTGVANNAANTITFSGNFGLTLTLSGTTSVTLPTSGTLVNTSVTALSSLTTIGTVTSGGLGSGAVIGGVTMTLGSDATGDTYYRNSSGVLTRLGVGSSGYVLGVSGGLPAWVNVGTGPFLPLSGGTMTGSITAADSSTYGSSGISGLVALGVTPAANTANPVSVTGGSTTGSGTGRLGYECTGTLNTSGNVDGACLFINITNTSSGSGTYPVDIQVGSASKWRMDVFGDVTTASGTTLTLGSQAVFGGTNSVAIINSTGYFGIASGATGSSANVDTAIFRAAAGLLEISTSTTANASGGVKLAYVQGSGVAYASLPSATVGDVAYMTDGATGNCGDALCTTWGTTVTGGGGSIKLLIWYDGSNWTLIGK